MIAAGIVLVREVDKSSNVAARVASPDVKFVFDQLILGDKAIPEEVYLAAIRDFRPKLQAPASCASTLTRA